MIFYFIYFLLSLGSPAPDTKGLITFAETTQTHKQACIYCVRED